MKIARALVLFVALAAALVIWWSDRGSESARRADTHAVAERSVRRETASDDPVDFDGQRIRELIGLLGHDNEDVRRAAAQALKRLAPASTPALVAAARDPFAPQRRWAAELLPQTPEGFAVLRELLDDPDRSVRRAAILWLTDHGAKATAPLSAHLGGADDVAVFEAIALDPDIARLVLPRLAKALDHPELDARRHVAQAIADVAVGSPAEASVTVSALVDHLGVEDDRTVTSIKIALVWIEDPAIEPLKQVLGHPDATVRARAIDVLRQIEGVGTSLDETYRERLDSDATQERIAAALALASRGLDAKRVLPIIEEVLRGDDVFRSQFALEALTAYEQHAADAIAIVFRFAEIDAARDPIAVYDHPFDHAHHGLRQMIPSTLSALAAHAPAALVSGLHNKSLDVRNQTYWALKHADARATPLLFAEAVHADAGARAYAIVLLGKRAGTDARLARLIEGGLADGAWEVRAAAAGVLWATTKDAKRAMPVLIEALAQCPKKANAEILVEPLRRLNLPASVDRGGIRKLSKTAPNADVRSAAAKALSK